MIIRAINIFWLLRACSWFSKELPSSWNIYETNIIEFRMDIFLHSNYPCLALNRGLVLLITYKRPRRRTTWQSGWRFLRVLMEDTTFIFVIYMKKHWSRQICFTLLFFGLLFEYKFYSLQNMSLDKNTPAKSRNPENYTFLDKEALAKYTTDTGKILPRKYTGLTPMQQRKISKLIKKSRHMQLSL